MQRRNLSELPGASNASALLASLHDVLQHSPDKSLGLDNVSALVLDRQVPVDILESVWQHAHKQSEDELVCFLPANDAAHSLMFSALSAFPNLDSSIMTAWTVLQPFLTVLSPANLNHRMHNGVAFSISLNSHGDVISTRLKLAHQPLLSLDPLLKPQGRGWRTFDVFYHMLYSFLDDAERSREWLGLKSSFDEYDVLKKCGSNSLPEWVTFADDYTLAKDWSDAVRNVFPKKFWLAMMSTLSGILLLGNGSRDPHDLAEGAALIGLDFSAASKFSCEELMSLTYTSLIFSVENMLNLYLKTLDMSSTGNGADTINSVITLAELNSDNPGHKSEVLKAKFDNSYALNGETVQDGLELPDSPNSIMRTITKLEAACTTVEKLVVPGAGDFKGLLDPSVSWFRDEHAQESFHLSELVLGARSWSLLSIATASTARAVYSRKQEEKWSSNLVSAEIRDMFITEWAARSKLMDYTADYDTVDFTTSFASILPPGTDMSNLAAWAESRFSAQQFFQGHNRVYLSEPTWRQLNAELDSHNGLGTMMNNMYPYQMPYPMFPSQMMPGSMLSPGSQSVYSFAPQMANSMYDSSAQMQPPARAAEVPGQVNKALEGFQLEGNFLNGEREDDLNDNEFLDEANEELLKDVKGLEEGHHVEVHSQSRTRKAWVTFVWMLTFWIPSPILNWMGGMKRSDVRLAWREKVVIFFLIFLFNCAIIFYMIILGRLICPDFDKVWNHKELSYHQGTNDFYVAVHGNVYDITKFYSLQHSDNGIRTSSSVMLPFAGLDLSDYFPPPLTVACPSLVTEESVELVYNQTRSPYTVAMHKSGPDLVPQNNTALYKITWYEQVFQPKIKNYYKGRIVETDKDIKKLVDSDSSRYIVTLNKTIYDMSNYMQTIQQYPSEDSSSFERYSFFPDAVTQIFQNYQGTDITEKWNGLDEKTRANSLECMNNMFVYGYSDFRHTAKCQAANVILLVLAGILTSITVIKFLASIRFGKKPMPAIQDRFVICQVPVYTEGEDDVRLAIDSLTNMTYDNRRKLIVILCDGMITGAGNDRPTPQIILDLLGVDETRIQPEAKAYHAIAEGAKELNYAKVYSGLYENDGNLVPFVCIIKCGAPGEIRPGNRGKRDSQLLLMNFLNRVHYGDPMCPLDLEIFHHINNIIGIEPERFEYLLTIDADTMVEPDALNRMVAACTVDNSISAVCGETGIENEKQSLSTMIQVYEYFISHHLTKAFESLFGSVTCLPGCFSLYRLRTMQRYKPLLISSEVIREYSLRHVDTLHKKNLFSLGEDRYLTTLMAKNFHRMKMKFVADAKCLTRVPDDFSVLLSQRRRWINSTVHNLTELLYLPNMCGFCLFSMRGIVLTDLVGTLMLPSVVVYLVYLIYVLGSHSAPLPLISIILICSVYGLQALVFIMHSQWQHIFWMIVYIAAYPFHSFILPIYSFWNMDNFSWGNTRIVVDESKGKRVVLQDDLDKYDPQSVPFESWHSYATRLGLPGRERPIVFDSRKGKIERDVFEDPPQEDDEYAMSEAAAARSEYTHDRASTIAYDRQYSPFSAVGGSGSRASSAFPTKSTPFDAGTEAQIRDTIEQVLNSTDLDTITSRQLRMKVGDLLGTEFAGDRAAAVDVMIDEQLEKMDDFAEEQDLAYFGLEEDPVTAPLSEVVSMELSGIELDSLNEHPTEPLTYEQGHSSFGEH